MIIALLYLVAVLLLRRSRFTRLAAIAMLLPIAVDCCGNVLCAAGRALWAWSTAGLWASWGNTLSATAWTVREHPFFCWTHGFIDFIFGAGHCQLQAEREAQYGSVWAAWWITFKNGDSVA